jgi:hypothetical protein
MGASAVECPATNCSVTCARRKATTITIALRLSLLATVLDLGWNKALNAADHDDTTIRAREPANSPGESSRAGGRSTLG